MQATNTEITATQVNFVVQEIINVLGSPQNEAQRHALTAFHGGDYQAVKRIASTNLSDNFCKSLGYLGGALKLTPNTDTIIAESARAAAEYAKEKTLQHLSSEIDKYFSGTW